MQNEGHNHDHGPTLATFNLIFVVLGVITIGEVAISELAGTFGFILLMTFTSAKAAIVAAYYMHLKYDPPFLTWVLVVPMIMGAAVILSFQGLAGHIH